MLGQVKEERGMYYSINALIRSTLIECIHIMNIDKSRPITDYQFQFLQSTTQV